MTDAEAVADLGAIARDASLSSHEPNEALGAGRMFGRLLWQNIIGPMADEELEVTLLNRHGESFARAAEMGLTPREPIDWLHVVSEAYDVGGHTALLERVLSIQIDRHRVALAVTSSISERFEARCAELGLSVYSLRGNLASRTAGLLRLGRCAERIMLHIHPDDLGAALAARLLRDEGHYVVFVNHADHVFGFGHGAADVVAEVSGFGWKLTSENRNARAQHFLGIPVPPPPAPVPAEEAQRAITTGPILSIGGGRKYRPDGEQNFQAFLMALMARTERPVELIGPTAEEPWWHPVKERFGDRLRLRGRLPFDQTRERLASAACYVDSFPLTGGTALTQGLMAGKAVFAPPFSAGGYSLADVLRSSSVEAMTDAIIEFLETGKEPANQAVIRSRTADELAEEGIRNRLTQLEAGSFKPPPVELLDARSDLRYHVDSWYRSGEPTFSWPPQAKPNLMTRAVLCIHVLQASRFRRPTLHKLLRWVLIGPRIS